jgi:hypothetical protein
MDALLAALTQRQNRAPATTPSPSLTPAAPIAFSPFYFPGTPFFSEAGRIRVATGEERENIHFTLAPVPSSTIEGGVNGNVLSLAAVQLAIIPDAPRLSPSTGGITSQPPNAGGEFKYGNLAPGRYRIVARANRNAADPGPGLPSGASGSSVGGGVAPPSVKLGTGDELLYAIADVEVRGEDIRGVSLSLQPGGTLSGKVVFDAETAKLPEDLTALRVGAFMLGGSYVSNAGSTRVGNALSSLPPVNLNEDGTFRLVGLGPTLYYLDCQLPATLSSVWKVRSAMVGGRDLLDTQIEGLSVNLAGITITLSDKRTELSGTLRSSSGQAGSDYYVIAFSADRTNWRQGSRRNKFVRPASDGRFLFADLPAGDYLIAALTDLEPAEWQDAAFLEQVAPAALKVAIAEGEKKTQDLRVK